MNTHFFKMHSNNVLPSGTHIFIFNLWNVCCGVSFEEAKGRRKLVWEEVNIRDSHEGVSLGVVVSTAQ